MTVTIENLYTSNGSTTDYSFTFPYLDTTDIKVSLDGVITTAYSLLNATTVRFNSAPNNGVAIRIYRETAFETPKATFYPGSAIRANDLNDNTLQNLYVNQESNDKVDRAWLTGDPTIISTESWHTTDDTKVATTKAIEGRIDTKIDSALTDDIAAGSSISITDNSPSSGKVTISVIAATGSNSGSMSASDKSKLDGIDTGAKDDQTAAEIRALVESATDSNVFTDADHSKLNAIEASATADQTNAEIRAAVEAATDSNVFTDADHTKLNAIEANATIDQTASEIKTLLQSNKLTDSEITAGTLDNRYYTETELDAGQLDNRYYTETESDARYFNISTGDTIKNGDTFPDNDTTIATTAAINDRIIDLVDDVGGFVPIANETSFPNANPDVNDGTGTLVSIKALSSNLTSNGSGVATISNGTVGNSTVTITGLENSTTYAATLGMIVETTSTLNTYAFHRVTPKATEVTTVAGSISNVNTVAGNISNVNTVAGNNTNINTVAGNNTNINTVAAANSNITTVAGNNTNITTVAGANSNISTVATNIANVNTVGGAISNVNTVATNISSVNDFAARYRISSSAPTSSLDTGDLYFDTTGNELKVYNGSAWQGGVTATGNLLSKAGDQMTGNLTFSGSQTVDGRDLSVDGAKLDNIAANANNYTHPNHSGEVTSTADGATVVADNIIDEANLKVSNSPTNGQFLSAQSGNTGGLTWATPSNVGGSAGVDFDDSVKIRLGTGNDFEIYHEGGSPGINHIKGVGDAHLELGTATGAGDILIKCGGDNAIVCADDAQVELYYDNSKRIETTSAGATVSGVLTTDGLVLGDGEIIKLGASSDLQIYHENTSHTTRFHAYADRVIDICYNETHSGLKKSMIVAHPAGSVNLYHNTVQKFTTTANGISVTGLISATGDLLLNAADSQKIKLGAGNDLEIYFDGSNSYIKEPSASAGQLIIDGWNGTDIRQGSTGEHMIRALGGGAVELYFNNVKKFETTADGVTVTGDINAGSGNYFCNDNGKLRLGGSQDLEIYHDGSVNKIVGTGAHDIEVYTNNTKRFTIGSNGNTTFVDDAKSIYGTGSDLRIYHDGTTNRIDAVTGNLHIKGSNLSLKSYADETYLDATANGAVEIFYDNSKKFETTSGGVNVTGEITVNGAALSSAPTITATADGAIAADKPCVLTSDGKVAQAALATSSESSGFDIGKTSFIHGSASSSAASETTLRYSADYDTTNKKILQVYNLGSGDDRFYGIVGTVEGSGPSITVSWGTPFLIQSNYLTVALCIYNPDEKKFLVGGGDATDSKTKFWHVTLDSAGTATVSSVLSFEKGNSTDWGPNTDWDGFVPCLNKQNTQLVQIMCSGFSAGFGSNPAVHLLTINMSGTAPTREGSYNTFNYGGHTLQGTSCVWDTVSNRVVIWFSHKARAGWSSWNHAAGFATWQVTYDSTNNYWWWDNSTKVEDIIHNSSSTSSPYWDCAISHMPTNGCFLTTARKWTGSGNDYDTIARVITIDSSGNITKGSELEYNHNTDDGADYSKSPANRLVVRKDASNVEKAYQVGCQSDSTANSFITTFTISGTGSSASVATAFTTLGWVSGGASTSWTDTQNTTGFLIDDSIVFTQNTIAGNSNNAMTIQSGAIWFSGPNADDNSFLGFSDAAYSNGATATIKVVGNTTTQSGLSPATKYYVADDGTLTTTSIENPYAGKALTATSLLIKG